MIDILLATYNGEEYISEQIEFILNQTYKEFRILIRDDGSRDNTVAIIKEYEKKYPNKVSLVVDDVHCGSSASNFMQLTKYATAEYVMYCDQDDYWLENKLKVTLEKMREIEGRSNVERPVLIFSTYKLADSKLKDIDADENKNQIATYKLELNRLLVQNYVTGCLMMVNKALYSIAGEYSEEILMHDWWFALIASAMGEIHHIPDVTMIYRQHGGNVVGAVNVKSMKYRISKIKSRNTRMMKYKYRDQAKLFLMRYSNSLSREAYDVINEFINLYDSRKIERIIRLVKGRYLKSDLVRVLGQLWYI